MRKRDEIFLLLQVTLDAIGRMGGPLYCRVTDVFSMPRPPAP